MSAEVDRAWLLAGLRVARAGIVAAIEQALQAGASDSGPIVVPNHRLSQILTSLAWHETRREPELRLKEAARELARLWGSRPESVERSLYALLIQGLGLGKELEELGREARERADEFDAELATLTDVRQRRQLERELRGKIQHRRKAAELYRHARKAADDAGKVNWAVPALRQLEARDRTDLMATARLLVALHAAHALATLQRTAPLRAEIQEHGGAVLWQQ